MGYFSWKEDEAYREGYNDGRYGRRDHFRDEHFGDATDKAYYEGLRQAEREEERRREMYEEERRFEEQEQRRQEEHRQYRRDLEEQEYYRQMEQEQYPEPQQKYPDDDLPFQMKKVKL